MIIGKEGDFDGRIEKASGVKIGYLSQDLFWQDTRNSLRTEMLMVFPEITEKMNRLMEIEHDDTHWEEADSLKAFMRENDGYARYDLQLEILKYFGFTDEQMDFNVLGLS